MSYIGISLIGGCYLLCAFLFLVWWAGFWQARGRERVAMVMYALMPFVVVGPAMLTSIEAEQGNAASIDWASALGTSVVCYIIIPLIVLAICRAWPFGPKPWERYRDAVKEIGEQSGGVELSLSYRKPRRKVTALAAFGLFAALSFGWIGWGMAFSETGRALQADSPTGGYFELGIVFIFFAVVILFFSVRALVRLRKAGPLDENVPERPPQGTGAPRTVPVFVWLAFAIKHFFIDE